MLTTGRRTQRVLWQNSWFWKLQIRGDDDDVLLILNVIYVCPHISNIHFDNFFIFFSFHSSILTYNISANQSQFMPCTKDHDPSQMYHSICWYYEIFNGWLMNCKWASRKESENLYSFNEIDLIHVLLKVLRRSTNNYTFDFIQNRQNHLKKKRFLFQNIQLCSHIFFFFCKW